MTPIAWFQNEPPVPGSLVSTQEHNFRKATSKGLSWEPPSDTTLKNGFQGVRDNPYLALLQCFRSFMYRFLSLVFPHFQT